MKSNTGQIKLNIFGGNGATGLLSSIPMRVEAANSSYIPINTNWDMTNSSPAILNLTSSGIVNIDWTDYSNHKFDLRYDKDKNHQLYNISSTWDINDVELLDDIAIVGMSDWTSTEKYTTEITSSQVSVDTFANVAISTSNTFAGVGDINGNNLSSALNLTTINIKNIVNRFQRPEFLNNNAADDNTGDYKSESNTPMGQYSLSAEFPDYSDIYLDISFTGDGQHLYSFGGFLTVEEYIQRNQRMSYTAIPSTDHSIKDDGSYKWYIVYRKTSGDYLFVTLSSYKISSSILTIANLNSSYANTTLTSPTFTKLKNTTDYGTRLSYSTGGLYLVQNESISITSMNIVKIANFLACGKVDIYTKKTGAISSYTSNSVTYNAHGLINGDSILIENGLNANGGRDEETGDPLPSGLTNINGIRYVSGVTTNSFNIYHDPKFQYPVNITNLRSSDGVTWTCVGPNQWNYRHTLYSPHGKNGYAFSTGIRTVYETGVNAITPYERAIETSGTENGIQKYQSYLNTWISWNNFYPFERKGEEFQTTLTELYNGNKFGTKVQLGKISNNNYLLMVTEPGAEFSFEAFDDFLVHNWEFNEEGVPYNQYIMPKYLPYGKVHLFKITKYPYSISYFHTISASGQPWADYETLNQEIQEVANYKIQVDDFRSIYNRTDNKYWVGARFYSWSKEYDYDTTLNTETPRYVIRPNQFAFLDSLGKGAAFTISNGTGYIVASTNVKSSDFTNSDAIATYARSNVFACNLTNSGVVYSTGIVNPTLFISEVANVQKEELKRYGHAVNFDDPNTLLIGWPSLSRNEEYIYIYSRSGINYNLTQTITSQGNNGFGGYIAANNHFLATDRKSTIDDSGNSTAELNYAYIYQKNPVDSTYYYLNRISPTIDLTNPQYANYQSGDLVFTSNLSYDNTTLDSATQTIDLHGRYDIDKDVLILKDNQEYIYYAYDSDVRAFRPKNHTVGIYNEEPVIKIHNNGKTLDIVEGGEILSSMEFISKSYSYVNYPTLFLKAIDGVSFGSGDLYTRGHMPYSESGNLVIQGPFIPTGITSGVNLYVKQPDVITASGSLFIKQLDIFGLYSASNLIVYADQISSGMPLVLGSMSMGSFPLLLKTYEYENGTGGTDIVYTIGDSTTSVSLYTENSYTGVPNLSGAMSMHVMPLPFDDYAQFMNLTINMPSSGSSSGINLFIADVNGTGYNSSNLYLSGPLYASGTQNEAAMGLFINRPTANSVPLFVYNNMNASGLNLFTDCAYIQSGNASLFVSGKYTSNSGITLSTFGTVG